MNYYQDIKISPDTEMRENKLLNMVFTKLHKALYDLNTSDIGISFPQAKKNLGCVVRIHSNQNRLNELQAKNWLGGLSGYCKISAILSVPNEIKGHQTLCRIRQTMTDTKLKKRVEYQKSTGILDTRDKEKTYIKQYKNKMFATSLDNPYLELQSTSTSNKYRLYIQFGQLQSTAVAGEFNQFGLSKTATVPIF